MTKDKGIAMGLICHTCGGNHNSKLVVICDKCKETWTHVYCLKVIPHEIPEQWYCEECIDHEQASNDPKGNSLLDKPSLNRAQFESVPPSKAPAPPQTGHKKTKKKVKSQTRAWMPTEELMKVIPLRVILPGEEDSNSFHPEDAESSS